MTPQEKVGIEIQRLLALAGLNYYSQLSKALGYSPDHIAGLKRRGKVPRAFYNRFHATFGAAPRPRDVNLDQALSHELNKALSVMTAMDGDAILGLALRRIKGQRPLSNLRPAQRVESFYLLVEAAAWILTVAKQLSIEPVQ